MKAGIVIDKYKEKKLKELLDKEGLEYKAKAGPMKTRLVEVKYYNEITLNKIKKVTTELDLFFNHQN